MREVSSFVAAIQSYNASGAIACGEESGRYDLDVEVVQRPAADCQAACVVSSSKGIQVRSTEDLK